MDPIESTTTTDSAANAPKAAAPKVKKAKAKKAAPKAKAKGKAKGKAKAKKESKLRKSTQYAPSAKLTEKAVEGLGNQAQIVAAAIVKRPGSTLAELAAAVGGKLSTKQDPKRVVAFYLTQFKNDGLIKKAA